MALHSYGDALIEVSVLSSGRDDSSGWVAEFWDLTPNSRGEFMHIHKDEHGVICIDLLGRKMEVDLVEWAISVGKSELADY